MQTSSTWPRWHPAARSASADAPAGLPALLSVLMDTQNHNVLVWNVRGLNARCRRDSLREVVRDCNAAIVCVQETKLAVISPFLVNEMLGTRFSSFAYLPADGTRGGILVACRSPELSCTPCHCGQYSVSVLVSSEDNEGPWCFTGVYGPQADVDKIEFLDELRSIQASITCPWLLAGDFNLLLEATNKNNLNINRRNMGRFRRFVDEAELKDIHLHGRRYTWSTGTSRPTLEKLDRILVTVEWDLLYPNSFLQALSSDMSDHCPLLLTTDAAVRPKRRFHFENFWIKIPGYLAAVERGWQCSGDITDPFARLDQLLRNTAKELQSWSQKSVGQIKEQLLMARAVILQLDKAEEHRPLSDRELALRRDLRLKCLGLSSLERTMARLRSRITYLSEGDANTKLFHLQACYRTKKKLITKLEGPQGAVYSHAEKEEVLFQHFLGVLGTPLQCLSAVDMPSIGIQRLNLESLERPFSEDEVWATIQSLPKRTRPRGPMDSQRSSTGPLGLLSSPTSWLPSVPSIGLIAASCTASTGRSSLYSPKVMIPRDRATTDQSVWYIASPSSSPSSWPTDWRRSSTGWLM